MFPAVHTMWLMLVVVGLNVLGTIVILIQVPCMQMSSLAHGHPAVL